MNKISVLDKVRRWIDGESSELVLEDAARDAQVKPRSKAEEFIVKIARAVETVMQDEMVPLPQGTTTIPTEYVIFLSEADDQDWQGIKRRGLEQGLYHILAGRAREISGKKKLETKSFVLELRVDGTLEKGDVRVQHGWEDADKGKTGVLPRLRDGEKPATDETRADLGSSDIPSANGDPAGEAADGEVMTTVKPRSRELYKLEVWFQGERRDVIPVHRSEISIGRGSRSKPVDVPLTGDPEVSRRHATITADGNGRFWFENEGRNPATINNVELPTRQRVSLSPGVSVAIGAYTLRIQSSV